MKIYKKKSNCLKSRIYFPVNMFIRMIRQWFLGTSLIYFHVHFISPNPYTVRENAYLTVILCPCDIRL